MPEAAPGEEQGAVQINGYEHPVTEKDEKKMAVAATNSQIARVYRSIACLYHQVMLQLASQLLPVPLR